MPEGLRAGDESASKAFPIRNRWAKGWCISGRSWGGLYGLVAVA